MLSQQMSVHHGMLTLRISSHDCTTVCFGDSAVVAHTFQFMLLALQPSGKPRGIGLTGLVCAVDRVCCLLHYLDLGV